MTILVTGAAGFIGSHVSRRLIARGERVIGIDNLNAYNPVALKHDRLAAIAGTDGAADLFRFAEVDFSDHEALAEASADEAIDRIVHLGAQAGVRYSLETRALMLRPT